MEWETILYDDDFWLLIMWLCGGVLGWVTYMVYMYKIAKYRSQKADLLFKELYTLYTYGYLQHKTQTVHDLIQYTKTFRKDDWLLPVGMYAKMACGYVCYILHYPTSFFPKLSMYLYDTYMVWTISADIVDIWMQEVEELVKPHRKQLYQITTKEELLRG